jgi:hypothetical protein
MDAPAPHSESPLLVQGRRRCFSPAAEQGTVGDVRPGIVPQ